MQWSRTGGGGREKGGEGKDKDEEEEAEEMGGGGKGIGRRITGIGKEEEEEGGRKKHLLIFTFFYIIKYVYRCKKRISFNKFINFKQYFIIIKRNYRRQNSILIYIYIFF